MRRAALLVLAGCSTTYETVDARTFGADGGGIVDAAGESAATEAAAALDAGASEVDAEALEGGGFDASTTDSWTAAPQDAADEPETSAPPVVRCMTASGGARCPTVGAVTIAYWPTGPSGAPQYCAGGPAPTIGCPIGEPCVVTTSGTDQNGSCF